VNDSEPFVDLEYPDPPPPADLAERARRRGTTLRRRRRAAGVTGLVAGSVAVVVIGVSATRLFGGGQVVNPILTGSSGPAAGSGGPAPMSSQVGPVPTTQAGPAPSGTAVQTSGTASSAASSTASGAAAVASRCTLGELRVTLGTTQGAAGHQYVELLFTNTGRRTCTLEGRPGVSFLDAAGNQVGASAVADRSANSVVPVRLGPGASAFSSLALVDTMVYGTPGSPPCFSAMATRLQIFPPGSYQAVLIADTVTVCRSATVGVAAVRPIAAGRMS
jgi:Protein of unknown function (DUF4232)